MRHHRHHHGGPWGHRFPAPVRRGWRIARGVHRRVASFLVLAATLGALAGWIAHGSSTAFGSALVLGAVALALGPLAWFAMLRIAAPVWELARVAAALREGRRQDPDPLAERDDEVGEVAGALHHLADRLQDQLDAQRSLLAAVSHELRSPLGRVRVLVELAREGLAPESLHDDLQAEIDGMDALIGDLLAASRIDLQAVAPRPVEALDPARRAIAAAEGPPVSLRAEGDPGALRADPTLLARALAVLLDNARRHGGPDVTLTVDGDDETVTYAVTDDGPGFPPGVEEQVFEPFWRPPGSTQGGLGLGLALVRRIARAHDGEASAGNTPEGHARVWMRLPR